MSADSRMMNLWDFDRVLTRMFRELSQRYTVTDMSEDEYAARNTELTVMLIYHSIARSTMGSQGYLPNKERG